MWQLTEMIGPSRLVPPQACVCVCVGGVWCGVCVCEGGAGPSWCVTITNIYRKCFGLQFLSENNDGISS